MEFKGPTATVYPENAQRPRREWHRLKVVYHHSLYWGEKAFYSGQPLSVPKLLKKMKNEK